MKKAMKFRLLMHTRWKVQFGSKCQLVTEFAVPFLLVFILAMIRTFVPDQKTPQYTYEPVAINDVANSENVRGFCPDSDIIKDLMSSFPNAEPFKTADEMETHLKNFEGEGDVGVRFFQKSTNSLDKNITIGLSFGGFWHIDHLFPAILSHQIYEVSENAGGPPYYSHHFVPLMYTLTKKVIEKAGKGANLPNIFIQRFPYAQYKHNGVLNMEGMNLSYIFLFVLLIPVVIVALDINREVRTIEKKVMMIRGFHSWMIWTTCFLRYVITLVILSILSIFILFWDTRYGPIYEYSSVFLIFLLIFLIGLDFFALGCLMAVILPNQMWLITFLISTPIMFAFVYQLLKKYLEYYKNYILVLIFPTIEVGLEIVSTYEKSGRGILWSNLGETNDIDKFSLGVIYLILICEIVFFLVFAVLLEAFIRRKDEFHSHNFTNLLNKVNTTDVQPIPEESGKEEFFDDEPPELKPGIHIRDVSKDYGPNHILRNVSLNMYEDQITMLLGHNGAGKSTLISVLIGLLRPTKGTAVINGFDILKERSKVSDCLSICFQEDILLESLTVHENLVFAFMLKDKSRRSSKEEIDEILHQLDLEEKAHERVKKLSGGMKRKVSLAFTICGNSKVLMLDEPTAGLDPSSRRKVWDFIQTKKKGRTILMTTHYMDEADALGDRIAIMCHGRIVCCGSSFFLKKKYGTGYHLVIDRTPKCNPKTITALIRQYIPKTEVYLVTGTELVYLLPSEHSPKFNKMLREIEVDSQKLGVNSYGISLTDLEEVFMKVGSSGSVKKYNVREESTENSSGEFSQNEESGHTSYKSQSLAILFKYITYYNRNLSTLYIPLIFAVIFLCFMMTSHINTHQTSLHFRLKSYDRPIAIVENNALIQEAFISSLKKKAENVDVTRNITGRILEMGQSSYFTVKKRYIVGTSYGTDAAYAWFNGDNYHAIPLSVQLILQDSYKSIMGDDYHLEFTNIPLEKDGTNDTELFIGIYFNVTLLVIAVSLIISVFIEFYVQERVTAFKHLQFLSGINVIVFHLISFLFNFCLYIFLFIVPICVIYFTKPIGVQTSHDIGILCLIIGCFSIYVIALSCLLAFIANPSCGGVLIQALIFIPAIVVLIMPRFVKSDHWNEYHWVLKVIFPGIALLDAILILFREQPCNASIEQCMRDMRLNRKSCQEMYCLTFKCCGYDATSLTLDILIMIGIGLLIYVIVVVIEIRLCVAFAYSMGLGNSPPKSSDEEEDEDVIREASFVSSYNIEQHQSVYPIILKDLTKYYKKLSAVNGLCLSVQKAECFGLLGVNGAGKTTTFKMMIGLEKISYGDCWINGHSIKNEYHKARKYIGYCSQFGDLFPGFTARDTMEIIFLIRGVPRKQISNEVIKLSKKFDFEDHLDKKVENMSGGNRRKLCSSLALIGNPPIVFLDEPTTGMDPATKHVFWDAIHKLRARGTSIVLTSHSMEECEALCTRLAIMVKGRFQCIGSVQHLKSRFAKGFFIMIKLKKPKRINDSPEGHADTTAVEQFMAETFPTANLKEKHYELLRYECDRHNMRWSEIFNILENMKAQFDFEDYAVGQPNLEQIFLKFSKLDEDEGDHKKRRRRCC